MRLWVDDLRMPPGESWEVARTSAQAISILGRVQIAEMSLDHDLGGEDTTRPVVLWLCRNPERWPRVVRVHTMNPVGREYLIGMIYRYNPFLQYGYDAR